MKSLYRFLFALVLSASIPCCLAGQSAHPSHTSQSYDTLVQQGNANLQAGSNDQALTLANSAMAMNADRWEGYALAGGALMNLKRYEEAADKLSDAIKRAPEAKQTGLRELRKQCLLDEAGPSSGTAQSTAPTVPSSTSPAHSSLQESVTWITNNTPLHPSFYQAIRGSRYATYFQKIEFSGCTATLTSGNHVRDDMGGWVTSTAIDLSKLDPDAITIKTGSSQDGNPQIVVDIHSAVGVTNNTANYLYEPEAFVADTHRYSREDDPTSSNDICLDVDDQPGAERMKQAWHDAIVGCVNPVPPVPAAAVQPAPDEIVARGVASYQSGDYPAALEAFQQACNAGHPGGCTGLGNMYEHGKGVVEDDSRAAQLYETGCKGDVANACAGLGFLYLAGKGVPKDWPQSAPYFQKACDMGNAMGCSNLAMLHSTGAGVPKDLQLAAQLYLKACNGSSASACANLGQMYENGDGEAKDLAMAHQLYQKGCSLGLKAVCGK